MNPDKEWFYGSAADKKGPVREATLVAMARSGQLPRTTQVWSEGMPEWVAAGRMPFLFTPPPQTPPGQDPALNLLLPMGPQSGWAIASGYLGIVSLIPMLALATGALAIVFAVLGFKEIAAHPEKRGKGRCITGIVLGVLGIAFSLAIVMH